LACNNIESFDTTHGNIYRYSGSPEILADLALLNVGSQFIVDFRDIIVVDPTITSIKSIDKESPLSPLPSNTFHLSRYTDEYVLVSSSYVDENAADYNDIINSNSVSLLHRLSSTESEAQNVLNDNLVTDNVYSINNISSVVFGTRSGQAFRYFRSFDTVESDIVSRYGREWHSNYKPQTEYDVEISFNNKVVVDNTYVRLNTGDVMNKAIGTNLGATWLVDIQKQNRSYSPHMQFQLEYGGQVTRCMSVEAPVYGSISSVFVHLDELPLVHKIGVYIELLVSDEVHTTYSVKFLHPAEHPLRLFYEEGVCDRAADSTIVRVMKSATSSYRYRVQEKSLILLTNLY
jgi:hypothetical protein